MDDSYFASLNPRFPGNAWPVIPDLKAATLLSLQMQLEYSQWLDEKKIELLQVKQLQKLLEYAVSNVPYYREKFGTVADIFGNKSGLDGWKQLPLLSRSDIQNAGKALYATSLPSGDHGPLNKIHTSGSTGMPIMTLSTSVTRLFWEAFTIREHLWHRRDLQKKLVSIRPESAKGRRNGIAKSDWGPAISAIFKTGEAAALNSSHPVDEQAAWLIRQQAAYLLSLPSNIVELAKHFAGTRQDLPGLVEVRTYGEVAGEEVREICRQVWNVPVTDIYSSQEAGYIALQCPDYEHYHVQSENLLVEVLNDRGEACNPGETGRLVITTLHNFAMPLIRYELGDFAEAGGACSCGRGLKVLNKIMGRVRNMVTLPTGSRHFPSFPAKTWMHIAVIKQIQLVQKSLDHIEVRLVTEHKLNQKQAEAFTHVLRERLMYPFNISFSYPENIERGKGGKFEDFVSELRTDQ